MRFRTSQNQVRVFSLHSDEKRAKVPEDLDAARALPKCNGVQFPCRYQDTVFHNPQEWHEFGQMMRDKNKSTAYRSRSSHRQQMRTELHRQGRLARNIPAEWRLYNTQTGEVHDLRTYGTSSIA